MSASTPALRFSVEGDRVRIDVPRGHLSDRDLADLSAALDAIRPTLARACAAPLPARESWPVSWREAWDERIAIVSETGSLDVDPEAVADADLRVMVARGLVEQLPPSAMSERDRRARQRDVGPDSGRLSDRS